MVRRRSVKQPEMLLQEPTMMAAPLRPVELAKLPPAPQSFMFNMRTTFMTDEELKAMDIPKFLRRK